MYCFEMLKAGRCGVYRLISYFVGFLGFRLGHFFRVLPPVLVAVLAGEQIRKVLIIRTYHRYVSPTQRSGRKGEEV
jgi:hypothetical protein